MIDQLSDIQILLLIGAVILNVYTLFLFYLDKKRATRHSKNRIPEKKLLRSSFVGGGIGALIGMATFRHKTKHLRFQLFVPLSAIITGFLIYLILTM